MERRQRSSICSSSSDICMVDESLLREGKATKYSKSGEWSGGIACERDDNAKNLKNSGISAGGRDSEDKEDDGRDRECVH